MDESVGRLKEKAAEHQKFLSRRRRSIGMGLNYPITRSSKDINEGAPAPIASASKASDFLGN